MVLFFLLERIIVTLMEDPLPSLIVFNDNVFSNWLIYLYIGAILLLVIASAFFSANETAFACINQFKLKVKADEGDKKAKRILKHYEKFDNTLILSLLGNNLVNVALSTISTLLFILLLTTLLSDTWISLISTVVMTLITYTFGDMIPKIVARKIPERVAYSTINFFSICYIVLFPLIWILSLITKLFSLIFKTKEIPSMTEEDFTNLVEEIEEEGLIEEHESEIITASLDFTDTSVRDILTKRNKMFVIDLKQFSKDDINKIILSSSYSRIPVCYGSLDKIVGILHVKSYIKAYLKDPNISVLSTLQKPYFVTNRIKLDDLIEGFKKHHTHIAIVKKDDVVIGMVTMEDVLEELVGKIAEPLTKEAKK